MPSRNKPNIVDPRLSVMAIKPEPRSTPTPPPRLHQYTHSHPFASRVQMWTSASPSSFGQDSTEYEWPAESNDSFEYSIYNGPYPTSVDNTSAVADDNDESIVPDYAKLKGVYWPGMDIFDSATPEMKRKRNQKKDDSVVEQLECNSREVEPLERIFLPSGTLKRERRISGSSYEESSPIKEELSPQAHRFVRPALSELDKNRDNHNRTTMRTRKNRPLVHQLDHDVSEYDKPGYADLVGGRKRRLFDVYQDQNAQNILQNQPPSFKYLASEFQYRAPPEHNNLHHGQSQLHPQGYTYSYTHSPCYGQTQTQSQLLTTPRWHQDEKENYGALAYQYANYYPHYAAQCAQYSACSTGNCTEVNSTLFTNPFQNFSTYKPTEPDLDVDDQETISAPPSEV